MAESLDCLEVNDPSLKWEEFIKAQCERPYFGPLRKKLLDELDKFIVYPPIELMFKAYELTPFDQVKVVILGQDPYHEPGQAMGLSFSVPERTAIPPSLRNIFKEIESDLGIKCLNSGDLTRWATQGVFLLNAALTVRAGSANSHQAFGWSIFTDNTIKYLNQDDKPKVFMLWGNNARKVRGLITNKNHLILESAHPSPLSASRGFFDCKHFSQANEFLVKNNLTPINWQ